MRKTVGLKAFEPSPALAPNELDVAHSAHLFVTSESAENPIDHAFDGRRGPGSTEWLASGPGDQSVLLAFDAPQHVRAVTLEFEERVAQRTQEATLSASTDGSSFKVLFRQEFTFAPGGATFERERWLVDLPPITHLRLDVRPDKGGGPFVARLTSFAIETAHVNSSEA